MYDKKDDDKEDDDDNIKIKMKKEQKNVMLVRVNGSNIRVQKQINNLQTSSTGSFFEGSM